MDNQDKCHEDTVIIILPHFICYRFSGVFPSLNMAVKRREQTLQDYKRLQSKVEKYEEKEKTGPILTKLHQVLSQEGRGFIGSRSERIWRFCRCRVTFYWLFWDSFHKVTCAYPYL